MPPIEAGLLKPGTRAPDFEMAALDGGTIRLSDYRGSYVWMFRWRVGRPPCCEEIVHLQELYAEHKDKGFVVLGVNTADAREKVVEMLERSGVDFPNILDTTTGTPMAKYETLQGVSAVPMSYLIDRDGKVMDAWYDYDKEKAAEAVKRLKLGQD